VIFDLIGRNRLAGVTTHSASKKVRVTSRPTASRGVSRLRIATFYAFHFVVQLVRPLRRTAVTLLTTLDQVQLSPVPIRLLARVWKTSSYLRNLAVPQGFADRSAAVDVGGQADEGRSPGAFINAIREVLHAEMMRVEVGGDSTTPLLERRHKKRIGYQCG
jgi:hypothetical protein